MRTALREATELAHPMRIEDVSIDDYVAVFYPGGWGPMEDLPDDAASGRLLTEWLASGKPVSLVCHGPAALLATIGPDGTSPFAGYRLTGLSNAEEKPERSRGPREVAAAGPPRQRTRRGLPRDRAVRPARRGRPHPVHRPEPGLGGPAGPGSSSRHWADATAV